MPSTGADDSGVGQVQRRLLFDRAGAIELRHGLGAVGGENVDLLLRGQQTEFFVLQLRALLAQRCVGLLRALNGAGAGLHQAVVAGLLLLGELQIGFGGGNVGGLLFDDRLLQGDLRIEVADRGLGRIDVGMGGIERRPEVAVVDPGQNLPGFHRLVVADQHLRDVAGDLWRDDRGVGLDVGVVGRFQVAAGGEIAVAKVGGSGDSERQKQRQGCAPDRLL